MTETYASTQSRTKRLVRDWQVPIIKVLTNIDIRPYPSMHRYAMVRKVLTKYIVDQIPITLDHNAQLMSWNYSTLIII